MNRLLRKIFQGGGLALIGLFAFTANARSITSVTAAEDGDSITVAYDAKGDGEADTALYVAWGEADAGDTIASWPNVRRVALLGAEAGSTTFEFPAEVQASDDALVVRAFLATTTAPYDYLLDYIHGTGKQYFDTGFTVSPASCATIDALFESYVAPMRAFGTVTDKYAGTFSFDVYVGLYKGTYYWYSAMKDGTGDWVGSGLVYVPNTRYLLKLDGPNKMLYIDGVQRGAHTGSLTMTSAGTLMVFAGRYFNNKSSAYNVIDSICPAGNFYSFSLTSNDVAQCTWKPCVLAGRAGVYDEVSNTIVYSASGTDFEVGGATNVSTSVVSGDTPGAMTDSVTVRTASVAVLTGLDGIGGDTLSVTGRVESLNGKASCTVKILIGESEDSMTAWPGATKTLNEIGDFAFTLAPSDLASGDSASALKPGTTYCVCVAATLADETKERLSASRTVTMASEATWKATPTATKVAASNTWVTVTGQIDDLGMCGATTVSLWYRVKDTGEYVKSDFETNVTDTAAFSFAFKFPACAQTYEWQLRAVNASAGGTAAVTNGATAVSTATTDATTYTWSGRGAPRVWSDADNWDKSRSADDCLGYPNSADATAVFAAGTTNVVAFDAARTIAKLDLSGAAANVTFVQATSGTAATTTKLTATNIDYSGAGGALTLDGVALRDNGSTTRTIGADFEMTLLNGADFYAVPDVWYLNGGMLTLKGGSTFSVSTFRCACDAEIDDSTLHARYRCNFGETSTVEGTVVANWRFVGQAPHLYVGWDCCGYYAGAPTVNFEFLVPRGGYEVAPIMPKYITYCLFAFGNFYNKVGRTAYDYFNAKFNIIVSDESPAVKASEKLSTTLINWRLYQGTTLKETSGINTNQITTVASSKSTKFVWSDDVDTAAGRPHALSVELTRAPGLLLIIR